MDLNDNNVSAINKVGYSDDFDFPSIKTRYISMLVDLVFILLFSLGLSYLFEQLNNIPESIRGILFVVLFILYEPILVSFGCTIGQYLTGIRVRKYSTPEKKIWIINAFVRLLSKVFLGWISFFMIIFNDNRRAMHDYFSGSIVLTARTKSE